MDATLQIMANLGLHHNLLLCMEMTHPDIDDDQFPGMDWKEFYSNVKEPIPPNAPKPMGKPIDTVITQEARRPDISVVASQSM
ncbi:hypothetical protein ACHAXS_000833 [Conticribra weissflogii]